tara:strand:- start:2537 stop:4243 length:1707 start_codon:yes stop_codon:yes gene_type:complete
MKRLKFSYLIAFIMLLSLPAWLYAQSAMKFTIIGIKNAPLTNATERLNELAKHTPLRDIPHKRLEEHVALALAPFGYFTPKVTVRKSFHLITIYIKPGPRTIIRAINVSLIGEGQANACIKKSLSALDLVAHEPFDNTRYEKAKQTLLTAAEAQGYLRAFFKHAQVLVDKAAHQAEVTLILDTGPRFYFGQVQFDPSHISPELLKRYIPFCYGQPFSNAKILELNTRLSNTGYFSAVTVKPNTKVTSNHLPVNVHLQPSPRISYTVGAGFGTDTGPRGKLGYHVVPVNAQGHKFNLIGLGSMRENTLQAQYSIPGVNPVVNQYDFTGGITNLNYRSGKSRAALLTFSQRHNLSKCQRVLSLNVLHERYNYVDEPTYTRFALYPKASFTWFSRDKDQLFVPQGYRLIVDGLLASRALLSQNDIYQLLIDAKIAYTLQATHTRFYLHGIQGLTQINNINLLPLSLSLFLGGADNLKGFSYNSIGPGKILSYGGLELQQEVKENWYALGFVDIGRVYHPQDNPIRRDIGVGAMWVSPVGPIKVGLALPVDDRFRRLDHASPRLVINIGPEL